MERALLRGSNFLSRTSEIIDIQRNEINPISFDLLSPCGRGWRWGVKFSFLKQHLSWLSPPLGSAPLPRGSPFRLRRKPKRKLCLYEFKISALRKTSFKRTDRLYKKRQYLFIHIFSKRGIIKMCFFMTTLYNLWVQADGFGLRQIFLLIKAQITLLKFQKNLNPYKV